MAKTPMAVIFGNPPRDDHEPDKSDTVELLEDMQADTTGVAESVVTERTRATAAEDDIRDTAENARDSALSLTSRVTTLEGQVAIARHNLASARFATTANVNIASTTAFQNGATYDGLTLATNDRFVVSFQTTGSQNGVYVVQASGAPVRATDADAGVEVLGAVIKVLQGTHAGTVFSVTNTTAPTVGTDAITIVASDKQDTYSDGAIRRMFPPTMADGRQFFSGASGDPATRPALPAAFVFASDGSKCTVTLTASQEFNMSYAGLVVASAGKAVDVSVDYQIISGSMTNIGPQIFKIGAAPSYSSAGAAVDASTADSTTGVRKTRSARFSNTGTSSPTTTAYPKAIAWQSAAELLRPSIHLKAGGSGAVVEIYIAPVEIATPAAQSQRVAERALRAAMATYGQMDYYPATFFSNLASGDPDIIADATNSTVSNANGLNTCLAMVGPGDVQITQKFAHDATPGRIYVVEFDFIIDAGSALIDIICYRLGSTFTSLGAGVVATLGTFTAASGRQSGTVKFRDSASTGIVDWSAGGNPAAKLRFGLRATHDGVTPATVHIKTCRTPDAVSGGGGSSEDADRAEEAAEDAEAARDALEGILFIQNNPLFDNSALGWWIDAYTASPAGGQLAATQNGVSVATDATAKGGQKAAITLDNALVLWRKTRSVNTAREYAVGCSVKAASGTATISAGVACYDHAGAFLAYRWCAANAQSVGTSYTDFDGSITGEDTGDNAFPPGTKRVREAFRINGTVNVDLDQLIITYGG